MHYAYVMPRIAQMPSRDVQRARERFVAYLRAERMSVNAFSMRYGLTQSTVHRLVTGRTKTLTPSVRRILGYAKINLIHGIREEKSTALDNPRIRAALEQAWDGSADTAELLAHLIEVIGAAMHKRAQFKE